MTAHLTACPALPAMVGFSLAFGLNFYAVLRSGLHMYLSKYGLIHILAIFDWTLYIKVLKLGLLIKKLPYCI